MQLVPYTPGNNIDNFMFGLFATEIEMKIMLTLVLFVVPLMLVKYGNTQSSFILITVSLEYIFPTIKFDR